jgi:ParB-like nuclease domain
MFGSLMTSPTGLPALDAREDFARARRAASVARMTRSLARGRLRHPRTLPAADAHPARVTRLDVIPITSIVGMVEPSPLFDASFRPASRHLRSRWERIALAHRRGVALPPIAVRQRSDGYYVIDGRHRVSVALAAGRSEIDAWVS